LLKYLKIFALKTKNHKKFIKFRLLEKTKNYIYSGQDINLSQIIQYIVTINQNNEYSREKNFFQKVLQCQCSCYIICLYILLTKLYKNYKIWD